MKQQCGHSPIVGIVGHDPALRPGLDESLERLGADPVDGSPIDAAVAVLLPSSQHDDLDFDQNTPVLVVTDDASCEARQRTLARGARGVISVHASQDVIACAALVIAAGYSVSKPDLPTVATPQQEPAVSGRELGWLHALRNGDSVAVVAACAGLSERTMYRHLKRLYQRLDAANRNDAMFTIARLRLSD